MYVVHPTHEFKCSLFIQKQLSILMALNISPSFRVRPREPHVPPLLPVPPQVEQDADVERVDGDQRNLFWKKICRVLLCDENMHLSVYFSPERRVQLSRVEPLCKYVWDQALSSHTWWRLEKRPYALQLCSPGCRPERGHRPERRAPLRPEKWSTP